VGVSGHEAYKLHDKPIFLGSLGTTLLCLGNVGVLQVWYDIWGRFFVPPHPNQVQAPKFIKSEITPMSSGDALARLNWRQIIRLTGSDATFVSPSSAAPPAGAMEKPGGKS
jgi:hypothetical protein